MISRLISVIIALFIGTTPSLATEVIFSVTLDNLKIDGSTWDVGSAATGKGSTSLGVPISSAPPDISICALAPDNRIVCVPKPLNGALTSSCIDLYYCELTLPIPSELPFALMIFDVDPKASDIADYVIFTGDDDDAATLQKLEENLRDRVDQMSPIFTPWTRKRRQTNAITKMRFNDCIDAETGCRASQSTFLMRYPE